LIELVFESTDGRCGPLLVSPWLDHLTQNDLRAALRGASNMWLDPSRRRGFMRTVFNPLDPEHDITRSDFLMAARVAAEAGGLPGPLALTLAAAIQELESNIHEHSERSESGLLAFQATERLELARSMVERARDRNAARPNFERARTLAKPHELLGTTLREHGQLDEALRQYDQLEDVLSNSDAASGTGG
jgi:hypothetical protein